MTALLCNTLLCLLPRRDQWDALIADPRVQRDARKAWAEINGPEDDAAYYQAYDQIVETLKRMHARGVFMVPGTDLGGSFAYHRELELYQDVGMTAPEILAAFEGDERGCMRAVEQQATGQQCTEG